MIQETQNPQLNIPVVKCRFFVQYWGVKALYVGGVGVVEVGKGGWNLNHPDFFLQLKLISNITDEDALKAVELLGNSSHLSEESQIFQFKQLFESPNFWVKQTNIPLNKSLLMFDFLRSKGYVLPFMDVSVEKLIELGWVRVS